MLLQKEMEISVKEKRLGEPCGETLLGKTVRTIDYLAPHFFNNFALFCNTE